MTHAAPLAPGLPDPVFDGQAVFRAVLGALSRPGLPRALPAPVTPPAPLSAELAAIALALADQDAPIWLDAPLAAEPVVAAYLRFHTGAPIVADPAEAAYALVSDPASLPAFKAFAQGTPEYPDRSATLVLAIARFDAGTALALTGPGVKDKVTVQAEPLPGDLAARWRANRSLFPRGVDLLLAGAGQVIGLPRSTRVEAREMAEAR